MRASHPHQKFQGVPPPPGEIYIWECCVDCAETYQEETYNTLEDSKLKTQDIWKMYRRQILSASRHLPVPHFLLPAVKLVNRTVNFFCVSSHSDINFAINNCCTNKTKAHNDDQNIVLRVLSSAGISWNDIINERIVLNTHIEIITAVTHVVTRFWVTSSWYLRWSWIANSLSKLMATMPKNEVQLNKLMTKLYHL